MINNLWKTDCLTGLGSLDSSSVDLVYLDPPFFTNKTHKLSQRGTGRGFSFDDLWDSHSEYAEFLYERCSEMHRVLKDSGSLFFHCDKSANHIVRLILDDIFGKDNFRSEIIWFYKRWSNSKKGLLPSHQTIFFYSKTKRFKFKTVYTGYSASTNVDQILQVRSRNENGKTTYLQDERGNVVVNGGKKGVPLNDVWEIPYLNPKAKERVGYPTQKPILLLERIISLVTDEEDVVLDPFFGSGTTLVAAKLTNRRYIGFDISKEALDLAQTRLLNPVRTESELMRKGRNSYNQADKQALALLDGLELNPIHRNKGIDAISKETIDGNPILIRIQRASESVSDAAQALRTAMKTKQAGLGILVRRSDDWFFDPSCFPSNLRIVDAASYSISDVISEMQLTNRCS